MEPLVFDLTVDESFGNLQTVLAKLRPAWCLENVAKKEFTAGITNKITGFYLKTDAQVCNVFNTESGVNLMFAQFTIIEPAKCQMYKTVTN